MKRDLHSIRFHCTLACAVTELFGRNGHYNDISKLTGNCKPQPCIHNMARKQNQTASPRLDIIYVTEANLRL